MKKKRERERKALFTDNMDRSQIFSFVFKSTRLFVSTHENTKSQSRAIHCLKRADAANLYVIRNWEGIQWKQSIPRPKLILIELNLKWPHVRQTSSRFIIGILFTYSASFISRVVFIPILIPFFFNFEYIFLLFWLKSFLFLFRGRNHFNYTRNNYRWNEIGVNAI